MTATAHAIVGTCIAARFADPIIALPLAYGSHFLLDFIPHWDSGTNLRKKDNARFVKEAVIDGTVAGVVSTIVFSVVFQRTDFFYLYLVLFFALLPDIITVITRFILKKKNPLWDWNNRLQSKVNRRMQLPWGAVTQIVTIGIVYVVLFSVLV